MMVVAFMRTRSSPGFVGCGIGMLSRCKAVEGAGLEGE